MEDNLDRILRYSKRIQKDRLEIYRLSNKIYSDINMIESVIWDIKREK